MDGERPPLNGDVDSSFRKGCALNCAAHQDRVIGVLEILAEKRLWRVVYLRRQNLQDSARLNVKRDTFLRPVAHLANLAWYFRRISATAGSADPATIGSSTRACKRS